MNPEREREREGEQWTQSLKPQWCLENVKIKFQLHPGSINSLFTFF